MSRRLLRLLRYLLRRIAAWLSRKADATEDPEVLLDQARREMLEMQAKNRERAVQAITQKNNLQQMVDDTQKRVANLQSKAELALKRGDRDLALQLLKEKQQYESTLGNLQPSLSQAQKTAQALALKAQWKNSQIQIAMNKALEGMGVDDTAKTFDRAQEKIRNANSEQLARSELAKQRVDSRVAALDEAVGSDAAETELAAMEARLGLGSAPATTTTTTTAPGAGPDLQRQLAELEAKVGGGTSGAPSGGTS